jgi:hypothetical protein
MEHFCLRPIEYEKALNPKASRLPALIHPNAAALTLETIFMQSRYPNIPLSLFIKSPNSHICTSKRKTLGLYY